MPVLLDAIEMEEIEMEEIEINDVNGDGIFDIPLMFSANDFCAPGSCCAAGFG